MSQIENISLKDRAVPVSLSIKQRIGLDVYLKQYASSRFSSIAAQCRQAVNIRAIALETATDPEIILFLKEELDFLSGQIKESIEALSTLAKSLEFKNRISDP